MEQRVIRTATLDRLFLPLFCRWAERIDVRPCATRHAYQRRLLM